MHWNQDLWIGPRVRALTRARWHCLVIILNLYRKDFSFGIKILVCLAGKYTALSITQLYTLCFKGATSPIVYFDKIG